MYFKSNDISQNMFVFQPIFNTPELKRDKGTEYFIGWKSKWLYNSRLIPLHAAFLANIKYFRSKIGMQFNNTPLVLEKKELHDQNYKCLHPLKFRELAKSPLRNFTLKKLFVWCN